MNNLKEKIIENLFLQKKRLFFGEKMGYLVCQNCGGYYKLKDGESAEDFVACQCYGQLVYVESLEDIKENEEVKDKSVLKLNADSDHDVIDDSDYIVVNGDSEPETQGAHEKDQVIDVKKGLNHALREPTVKNRAYYRRYDYYSKPDITYMKNLKDVPGLINALFYDDPNIRLEAAQALSVVGDDRALEPLNKIINQEGGSLKLYAEIAVKQIRSKKYGYQSHSRDDYRKTSKQPTESPESQKPIPEISQEEVSQEEVFEDELIQKDVSEHEFPQEGVSEHEVIREELSGDEVKTDIHEPVTKDISKIHDEKDVSHYTDGKDITLTDEETEITTIDHGKDVSSQDDEIIFEEVKNKPSAVKESDIKLVDNEELSHDDYTDFEVSQTQHLKAEPENLKNLKKSNLEIPDDQRVEINVMASEGISMETNTSSESAEISETNKSSEKNSTGIPGKTQPVSLKTVDDTLISSDAFNSQPVLDSNNPSMIGNITGVFKNSATAVPTPVVNDKIVSQKPSPVLTNTTITHKKSDSFAKNEENTDKQIIGFIILFSIILIVGVILTLTQM